MGAASMFSDALLQEAEHLLDRYRQQGLRLATAESCTGGLIAACLTEIAGSSDVLERGFVTYSNEAKHELLGVPAEILERHGAVSAETAEAMARGSLQQSHADIVVSVTGIAGPGGGTSAKPVGLVFFGFATGGLQPAHHRCHFDGDRAAIRIAAVHYAFEVLSELAG